MFGCDRHDTGYFHICILGGSLKILDFRHSDARRAFAILGLLGYVFSASSAPTVGKLRAFVTGCGLVLLSVAWCIVQYRDTMFLVSLQSKGIYSVSVSEIQGYVGFLLNCVGLADQVQVVRFAEAMRPVHQYRV